MKGRILKTLLVLAGIIILAGAVFLAIDRPAGDPSMRRVVEIPSGIPFYQVAELLEDEHVIADKTLFGFMARLSGKDRKVIPGEYEFHAGMRPTQILYAMAEGRVLYHSVTIPEGYTVAKIANLLEEKDLADRNEFIRLANDQTFIKSLGLHVHTLEGYLFPDTYFLTRHTPSEDILRTFVQRLRQTFSPKLMARAKELDMTVQKVLTLASVIEKETGLSEERALVSGVFHNRLQRGMPLQSDPTVIYALKAFDGDLRRRDLAIKSPYNTYRVRGLPPGPIANPGEAAIRAALYPTPSKFVYFVSRNDGSHEFSATLAEHNKAVQKYQKGGGNQSS